MPTSFNEAITCNASECLSWIIILFNILTVFYLAFCAWFKITKSVKLFGWVWTAINVCVTVVLLFFHTCIFTLISAVFTGLITMATLSVVFNGGKSEVKESSVESDNKIKGYYVIFGTTDNKFAFRLYDSNKKYFMTSNYKYDTLDDVKKAIALSRKNGIDVMLEDRTSDWIKAVDVPKFVLDEDCGKYYSEYVITDKLTILRSENNKDIVECTKMVHKIMDAVLTGEIYLSKELLDGTLFIQKTAEVKPVEQQVIEEVAITEVPTETTLTESFEMARSLNVKVTINKQYIADYLENKYGKAVIVNRRANTTNPGRGKTEGLPLADTHYTVVGNIKKCFIYVYEISGTALALVKAPTEYAKSLQKAHKNVRLSAFPKSQDTWYSIVFDDSWMEKDVCKMLDDIKEYCAKEMA